MTWLEESRQPDAPQFSRVRSTRSLLGMAMTLGWEVHQLSATWARVLPASAATASKALIPMLFRPGNLDLPAKEPSARGV